MMNISDVATRLEKVLSDRTLVDDRVIDKSDYTWSYYDQIEGLVGHVELSNYTRENESRIRNLNMGLLDRPLIDSSKLQEFDIEPRNQPMDAVVRPVKPSESILYHLSPLFPRRRGKSIGSLDHLLETNRVIGNPDNRSFTFLKTRKIDEMYGVFYPDDIWISGYGEPDNLPVRFEIDVNDLFRYRKIFHDSMGISTEEAKNNYVIFGGIPIQTIKGFEILDSTEGNVVKSVKITR